MLGRATGTTQQSTVAPRAGSQVGSWRMRKLRHIANIAKLPSMVPGESTAGFRCRLEVHTLISTLPYRRLQRLRRFARDPCVVLRSVLFGFSSFEESSLPCYNVADRQNLFFDDTCKLEGQFLLAPVKFKQAFCHCRALAWFHRPISRIQPSLVSMEVQLTSCVNQSNFVF